MAKERCNGSWLGRHRFEARYDTDRKEVTPEQIEALNEAIIFSDDVVRAISHMSCGGTRYIHDVCIRCGEIASPPPLNPKGEA